MKTKNPSDAKADELREEKKQQNSSSSEEKHKVVMNGAKLLCKYIPVPGTLLVTSNQIKLQDQLWATEGDAMKSNLTFQGLCMHAKWGYNKPPCISVIMPVKWENVGTITVQEKKVLLKGSTIKCGISNEDIKILFDGQTCTPSTLSTSEMDI